MPTVTIHEDLLKHIAANGGIPADRSWVDDVLPIFVQAVQETLDSAADAFRENMKDASSSSATVAAPPPPTTTTSFEHSEESFQSESAYLVDQLRMCIRGPPFTLQRLAEVLLGQDELYRTARGGTVLRADVLQTAIRKCVLVSALE